MRNLINKELKLTIPRTVLMFALFAGMILIPNYPSAVAMIYFIFEVQIIFQLAMANKDLEFTSMLPIPRRSIVLSKHITVMILQMLQIILAIPFALISMLVISKAGNSVGLDTNFAFFGVTLIGYSVFNIVFLPLFYKTGYKMGLPIVLAIVSYICTVLFFEVIIAVVPVLKAIFDSVNPSMYIYQILFLIAGIIIYFGSLFWAYKLSVKKFEKVNI